MVSFSHLPTGFLVRDGAWHWEDEYPKNLTSWIEAGVGWFALGDGSMDQWIWANYNDVSRRAVTRLMVV